MTNRGLLFAPKTARVALKGARALETAFDWDEEPHGAEFWVLLQDLLYAVAGTSIENEARVYRGR